MKCDNCKNVMWEPPDVDSPYGEYACTKGHWEGGPVKKKKAKILGDFAKISRKIHNPSVEADGQTAARRSL